MHKRIIHRNAAIPMTELEISQVSGGGPGDTPATWSETDRATNTGPNGDVEKVPDRDPD